MSPTLINFVIAFISLIGALSLIKLMCFYTNELLVCYIIFPCSQTPPPPPFASKKSTIVSTSVSLKYLAGRCKNHMLYSHIKT